MAAQSERNKKRRFFLSCLFNWTQKRVVDPGFRRTREPLMKKSRPSGGPLQSGPVPYIRINITQTTIPEVRSTSMLLTSIPLEIRQQIFHHVLGGRNLHLVRVPGSVMCSPKRRIPWKSEHPLPEHFPTAFDTLDLALLRTCRQIYIEAISIVYGSNVFNLEDPAVLMFLYEHQWLRSRLMAIKHVEMQWLWNHTHFFEDQWERFWRLISTMTLRSLKLCCLPRGLLLGDNWWRVRPMLAVHGIRHVEIEFQGVDKWKPEAKDLGVLLEEYVTRSMMNTTDPSDLSLFMEKFGLGHPPSSWPSDPMCIDHPH